MVSVMLGSEAPIVPAPQTLLRLSADRLVSWHRERYVPQNAVLSIVGDVDQDEAERMVRAQLSGWARTSFADPTPAFRVPAARVVHVLDCPGSVQTAVMLGGMAPTRADGDYPAILLGSLTLGGQSGRLMRALREARGWSYNPQAGLLTSKHGGVWLTYGDVSSSRTGEALTVFVDELRKIATVPVSAAERPREAIRDRRVRVESGIARGCCGQHVHAPGRGSLFGLLAAIPRHRPGRDCGGRSPRGGQIHRSVEGTDYGGRGARLLVPQLTPFGPISFYDQDGRRIVR